MGRPQAPECQPAVKHHLSVKPQAMLTYPAQQTPAPPAACPHENYSNTAVKACTAAEYFKDPTLPVTNALDVFKPPQVIKPHTSEDEKVQAIQQPDWYIYKSQGRKHKTLQYSNSTITKQHSGITASTKITIVRFISSQLSSELLKTTVYTVPYSSAILNPTFIFLF